MTHIKKRQLFHFLPAKVSRRSESRDVAFDTRRSAADVCIQQNIVIVFSQIFIFFAHRQQNWSSPLRSSRRKGHVTKYVRNAKDERTRSEFGTHKEESKMFLNLKDSKSEVLSRRFGRLECFDFPAASIDAFGVFKFEYTDVAVVHFDS